MGAAAYRGKGFKERATEGNGRWREANRRRQLQTAIHPGVMPPLPPFTHIRTLWDGSKGRGCVSSNLGNIPVAPLPATAMPVTITASSSQVISSFILGGLKSDNPDSPYASFDISFSAQTSSKNLQERMESKLHKKRGVTVLGAPPNKHLVFFVDDLNMPALEEYGASPPIELLRQVRTFCWRRGRFFVDGFEFPGRRNRLPQETPLAI